MRTKLFVYLFTVVVTTVFFSCSQEKVLDDSQESFAPQKDPISVNLTKSEIIALAVEKKGTYLVSENEAHDKLLRFSSSSGNLGDNQMRSATLKTNQIRSTTLKKNPITDKAMYYEVVFDSDKGTGFALVSADERISEVLCYSEFGSISDTLFNKSLKFCLDLIDLYVEEETKEELDIDALVFSAQEKLGIVSSTLRAWPLVIIEPPIEWEVRTEVVKLKQVPGGWHQEDPYNDLLPLVSGGPNGRAYVGCAMVAVSQIMAYHEKPFSNYISKTTWTSIKNDPENSAHLKKLMSDLFNAMVIPPYGLSGTPSSLAKARSFLNSNGYTAGIESNYSFSGVLAALNDGPTYIRGSLASGEGHAWVVDGARIITSKMYMQFGLDPPILWDTAVYNHVRFDWGYGHMQDPTTPWISYNPNVWYSSGVFQVLRRPDMNFNINVKMISYIK